jgi:cytochrome c biogenesis protein CcmG, thiol:disulfide interchange protein DsbE
MAQRRRILAPVPLMVIAIVLALVGLLGYGIASRGTDNSIDSQLARGVHPLAPTPTLAVLGGSGKGSLANYRGKVVLLNYWASWCDPCRAEAPILERWQAVMKQHGGTVLGVDAQDLSGDASKFVNSHGLTYPSLRDGDGHTQGKLGITGMPESFVIDRQGHIVATRRFAVDDAFMRAKVMPLLEGHS